MPARTWRVHAVGVAPTERFKLRRQMAAAAGKKGTTSLYLFMEVFGIVVEEENFYFGRPVLGRRSFDGEVVPRTKRSLDESDLRGSNVEASGRTTRSC